MYGIQFNQTVFAALRLESVHTRRGLGHAVLLGHLRFHNQAPSAQRLPHLIHVAGEVRNSAGHHVAELRPATLKWWPNRSDDTMYVYAPVSFRTLSILTDSRKAVSVRWSALGSPS